VLIVTRDRVTGTFTERLNSMHLVHFVCHGDTTRAAGDNY
jgi:hypothetical protein